jgi:hypothetical protein
VKDPFTLAKEGLADLMKRLHIRGA